MDSDGNQALGEESNEFTLNRDGIIVAFESEASNLVSGDTNEQRDIFTHNLQTGVTTRVSVDSNGNQALGGGSGEPVITPDGRFLAFNSNAFNLVPDDINGEEDLFVRELSVSPVTLVGEVFPSGRAVQVGNLATTFFTVENMGTEEAFGCDIAPFTPVPGAAFLYARVDPVTSAIIGQPNASFDIPGGTVQKFNFTFVPEAPLAPMDVQFNVVCANGVLAATTSGINTFLLSASLIPVADMVALTSAPNGQLNLPSGTATGAFLIASLNLGDSDVIAMSADTGNTSLPLNLLVCEFDASIGNCLTVPSPTSSRTISTGEVTFFCCVCDWTRDIYRSESLYEPGVCTLQRFIQCCPWSYQCGGAGTLSGFIRKQCTSK